MTRATLCGWCCLLLLAAQDIVGFNVGVPPTSRQVIRTAGNTLGHGRHTPPALQALSAGDLGEAAAAAAAITTTTEFGPDFSNVGPQLAVLGVAAALTAFWWKVVVPSERVALSRSKRRGPIKEYLDDLDSAEQQQRGAERWFFANWLRQRRRRGGVPSGEKDSFFLSTDNPVVVTGILVAAGALYSAITAR